MNHFAPARHFENGQPDDEIAGNEAGINIEAEQSVLGAILHNNAALQSMPFLEADYFAHPVHRDLFAAIRSKVDGSRVADAVTLIAEFRGRKVDDMSGAQYIAALMANVVTILHARDHAICVLEAYATRLGIEKADEFVERLRTRRPDETITEIVGELEDDLASIRALSPKADTRTSLSAYCDGLMQKFSDQDAADRTSIPFPLPEIASILQEDGFEPGNLYGLLASSGEGKTSLILQFARTAAEAGHPVLLLSFDQNGIQVVRQMASQATGITLGQMKRRNGMNEREWGIYMQEEGLLRKLPMEVVRLRQEKIGRICGQARAFAKRWSTRTSKAPLIILDHNRKVTPDRPNDHEGRIAGAINGAGKALAEEIGAAVLYIMQRNGGGLRREVPRPIAADLFGGEGAREDFDGILYLYRAQKWRDERLRVAGSEQERIKIRDRFKLNGDDPENKAELGAIKVRYGDDAVREIVAWEGRLTRYVSTRTAPKELPF